MNKTLLFSSLLLSVGTLSAQNAKLPTAEEMLQQHLKAEMQRHGITPADAPRTSEQTTPAAPKATKVAARQLMAQTEQRCDSIVRYYGNELYTMKEFVYAEDGTLTTMFEKGWRNDCWNLESRTEFLYDDKGQNTEETYYYYNSYDQSWNESFRYEYTYDEYGNQTGYTSYDWSMYNNEWEGRYRMEYAYDADGNQTMYASYSWNGEMWVGSYRSDFAFNADGFETSYTSYNFIGNEWVASYRSERTFDDQNRVTTNITFRNDNDEGLIYENKYEYAFDEYGNQSGYCSYYWANGAWMGMSRQEQTFTPEGYELFSYSYTWSSFDNDWIVVGGNKTEYVYDSNGFRQESYTWYLENGAWIITSKAEYTCDAYGQATSVTRYWWNSFDESWITNYRYAFEYDALGHTIAQYTYLWDGYEFALSDYWFATYDEQDRQLSYSSYWMKNGETIGQSRYDRTFDVYGHQTSYCDYRWCNGDWVLVSQYEESYDDFGNQTGHSSLGETTTYVGPVTLKVDLSNSQLLSVIDQQDLLFTGGEYSLNALYVDEYLGEMALQPVSIWQNDGSHGMIDWSGEYRFSSQNYQTGEEIYAFSAEDWNVLKTGTFYVDIQGAEPQIRVTTGWWTSTWTDDDIFPGHPALTQTGPDTWTLTVNLEGAEMLETMDQQHLLFTGSGYTVRSISIEKMAPVIDIVTAWQNDGSHGEINWSVEYRFANEQYATGDEIHAFTMDEWNILKTGTFYVDIQGADPQVRVTTGWWTSAWTGDDIFPGHPALTQTGDDTWTLAVNLEGAEMLETMDQQHLLFTGSGYTVLAIRMPDVDQSSMWEHRCIWQNENPANHVNWNEIYRFGKQGHEADCIATFDDADWELIRSGMLTAEIEFENPNNLNIYVTSGWWSYLYTENYIYVNSPLLSGETDFVFVGSYKTETTYNEQGNTEANYEYEWDWSARDWRLTYTSIYYYAEDGTTDIHEALSQIRPRLGKEMRNGTVYIVVGNKTYTLDGQEVTK